MAPVSTNLTIYQGDRYELFFRLRQEENGVAGDYLDLTGCVVRSHIRGPDGALGAEFTCTIADQATSLGSVLCVLTPTQTAALDPKVKYVWDLEIQWAEGPDHIETLFGGTVAVTPEVTRVAAS